MLIQGDNLEALKALLPFYAGRVKCIFIDPPYNTRSAFEHYDDNLEHTQWLGMMYPPLELLRDLLTEDGSIWVTIDDNEAHYLKVIMDEVFGRANFVANIIWQKSHTRENRTDVSTVHDNLLLFAKNHEAWQVIRNPLPASESQIGRTTQMKTRGDRGRHFPHMPRRKRAEGKNNSLQSQRPLIGRSTGPPDAAGSILWNALKKWSSTTEFGSETTEAMSPRLEISLRGPSGTCPIHSVVPHGSWYDGQSKIRTHPSISRRDTLFHPEAEKK